VREVDQDGYAARFDWAAAGAASLARACPVLVAGRGVHRLAGPAG